MEIIGMVGIGPFLVLTYVALYAAGVTWFIGEQYRWFLPSVAWTMLGNVVLLLLMALASYGALIFKVAPNVALVAAAVGYVLACVLGVSALALACTVGINRYRYPGDPYGISATFLLIGVGTAELTAAMFLGDGGERINLHRYNLPAGSMVPSAWEVAGMVSSLLLVLFAYWWRPAAVRLPWWVWGMWMGISVPLPLVPLSGIHAALYEEYFRHRDGAA